MDFENIFSEQAWYGIDPVARREQDLDRAVAARERTEVRLAAAEAARGAFTDPAKEAKLEKAVADATEIYKIASKESQEDRYQKVRGNSTRPR